MKKAERLLFIVSLCLFIFSATVWIWQNQYVKKIQPMDCSTKIIMRFEDMEKENVNGNVHFSFGAGGKGYIVVEGYTDSQAGWLYLQRYVKFTYTTKAISPTEWRYRISKWEARSSTIDQSPDIIFDYFMREMSNSHDGLLLSAQKLNDKAILLSAINSPLYICKLKSDSRYG